MKKILSILQVAFIALLTDTSIVSCGQKKLDYEVSKRLNYTDDKGNSKLDATPELKNDKFIYDISGYHSISNKVSGDDITDDKIKSFVEKTLKVTKKEEFKDIKEEFHNVEFDTKVESNIIKFTNGKASVILKKGNDNLKTFTDIKIKDFELNKADIIKFLEKITDQDFKHDDLKGKATDTQADFKSDSTTGKALKDFAKTINKKLDIKITTQSTTDGTTLKISLKDLDAEKIITVKYS